VTDEEHDLLRVIYAEAQGRAEKWVAVTELPSVALVLARTGYLTVMRDGSDLWHVALTDRGQELARQISAGPPGRS
jgi:hypothetical protein